MHNPGVLDGDARYKGMHVLLETPDQVDGADSGVDGLGQFS
ncbi:hypothetical protein [Paenibacillus terrae]|nr:hypothetical protein [Paenibacillus terrae]